MATAAVLALFGLIALYIAAERAFPPQPGPLAGGYGKWLAFVAFLLVAYLVWRSHAAIQTAF